MEKADWLRPLPMQYYMPSHQFSRLRALCRCPRNNGDLYVFSLYIMLERLMCITLPGHNNAHDMHTRAHMMLVSVFTGCVHIHSTKMNSRLLSLISGQTTRRAAHIKVLDPFCLRCTTPERRGTSSHDTATYMQFYFS